MKKNLFYALGFSALFVTASLFSSCKKTEGDIYDNSEVYLEIYYEQKAPGAPTGELWSIRTDNLIFNAKTNITLPSGWEKRTDRKVVVNYPERAVSAYNPTTDRYGVIVDLYPGLRELTSLSGADVIVQGFFGDSTTTGLIYSKRNLNNEIEFWRTVYRGNDTYNRKINIPLPANASFVEEPFVNTSATIRSKIAFATRVGNTYSIYQCSFNGSVLSVVTTDEPGVALGVEEVFYPGRILYSKVKSGIPVELWLVNSDGTDKHKINLDLPAGTFLKNKDMARLSNNGDLVFTTTTSNENPTTAVESIYAAKIDGSGIKLIKKFAAGVSIDLRSLSVRGGY